MSFNVNGYNPYQQKSFPYGAPQRPLPQPGVQASGLMGAPSYLLPSAASTPYNKPFANPAYTQQRPIQRPASSLPFRPVGPHGAFYSHSSLMPGVMPNSRLMPGASGATIHNNYYTNPTDPPEVRQKKDIKKFVLNTLAAATGGFVMLGIGVVIAHFWYGAELNFLKAMGGRTLKSLTTGINHLKESPEKNMFERGWNAFSQGLKEWNRPQPASKTPWQRFKDGWVNLFNFILRRKPPSPPSTPEPAAEAATNSFDFSFDSIKKIIEDITHASSDLRASTPALRKLAEDLEKARQEGVDIPQALKHIQQAASQANISTENFAKLSQDAKNAFPGVKQTLVNGVNTFHSSAQGAKEVVETIKTTVVPPVQTAAGNVNLVTQDMKNTFEQVKPTVINGVETFDTSAKRTKEFVDIMHDKILPQIQTATENINLLGARLNTDYSGFVDKLDVILKKAETTLNNGVHVSEVAKDQMKTIWPRVNEILDKANKAATQGEAVTTHGQEIANQLHTQLNKFLKTMETTLDDTADNSLPKRVNNALNNLESIVNTVSNPKSLLPWPLGGGRTAGKEVLKGTAKEVDSTSTPITIHTSATESSVLPTETNGETTRRLSTSHSDNTQAQTMPGGLSDWSA